jgi:S-formylglutathione hydrolase FrmB
MVVERTIPSTDTFRPRPGFLYVPPILLTHPERRVPVLELLHGTPGEPSNWFTGGFLRETADAFAKAHGGLAPLVVVPDVNGARRADSQCIRTANGADVEHYLTSDVVRYVRDRYGMAVGTERWWIAGLSEGGICSAVLALRHPDLYSAFGDMSGLLRPTVDHLSLAGTNRQLYQDNPVAEREHDPQWLLSHRPYTAREGAWFLCGAQDVTVRRAQVVLVAASRRAGLLTHSGYLPGTHRWVVWSAALRLLLPWLWLNFGV